MDPLNRPPFELVRFVRQPHTALFQFDNGSSPIPDATTSLIIISFKHRIIGYDLISVDAVSGDIELKIEQADPTAWPTYTEISSSQRPTITGGIEDSRTVALGTLTAWTLPGMIGEAYSKYLATVIGDAVNISRAELALAIEVVS
jgi:hypothetical protein